MNKKLKNFVIGLNLLMLLVSVWWLIEELKPEPIIVFFGQIGSILILIFENSISKKFEAGNVDDSELLVENKDNVKMKDIIKSKVKVK